jgi:phage terminase large subunit GpA-like protein
MAKGKTVASKFAVVGVDVIKTAIFDRLQRGQGIRFSNTLEPAYFEQIASQRRVIKYSRGMPTRRFEMVSSRARKEALDCLAYGWAARQSFSFNMQQRESQLRGEPLAQVPLWKRLAGHEPERDQYGNLRVTGQPQRDAYGRQILGQKS